jgi:site-specific DNA-methyltransferase (adenine-specific)
MSAFDLRLGDCLDPAAGMASLRDGSVDHVICDPPYEPEAHTLQRRIRGADTNGGERICSVEPLDFSPIAEADRVSAAAQFARVARRWILVFCQAEAVAAWRDSLIAAGATYKRSCVWVKPDGMPQLTGDRPAMGYESIVAAHAPGRSSWNGGGQRGVFVVNKGGDKRSGHPTQKPIALMEKLVRLFTDPGDMILDPFAGSGTTGVAALRMGRRFIGFERDSRYHAIALKRLSTAREQLELSGITAAEASRTRPCRLKT